MSDLKRVGIPGGGSSLSPPTEDDLAHISMEAMKWAEVRTTVSSKAKEIGADANTESGSKTNEPQVSEEWYLAPQQVLPMPIPSSSGLSLLLSGDRNPGYGRTRFMNLKIFCPFIQPTPPGRMSPVTVTVPDHANVSEVVRACLRVLREENPDLHINLNPDAYRLRVAEDETGRPDEDLPVLDRKTSFRKMGIDTLVLSLTATSQLSAGFESPQRCNTYEDIFIKVLYGSERKRHRRVTLPPDALFKDSLALICERLKKDTSKYTVKLILDGIEKDALGDDYIPVGERTLGTLHRHFGVREIYLKSKGKEDEDAESDSSADVPKTRAAMFCDWDEASASRYTEYHVIKINKFGSRQPRTLGIDREKIYNMMRGTKGQKTRNPERSLSDIIFIRTFDDKPNYFEIEYKNSKSGKDQIECQSPMEAHEISTKVRFLLELHKKMQSAQTSLQPEKKTSLLPMVGMDKLLAKITPQVLHSPRGERSKEY